MNTSLEQTLQDITAYQPSTVLVICIGASPAVLTETVYGMMQKDLQLPSKIVVFTTKLGYEKLKSAQFFHVDSPLRQLVDEYGLPNIEFSQNDVHVVQNAQGDYLDDVATEEDNTYMADMITDVLRELVTAKSDSQRILIPDEWYVDPLAVKTMFNNHDGRVNAIRAGDFLRPEVLQHFEILRKEKRLDYKFRVKGHTFSIEFLHYRYQIHMSPSGGRKTMTFLSGYIMTLLARSYDVMSHVLIDDKAIGADFYYTTKRISQMTSFKQETFCPADIEVKLSLIPFVRHANKLPAQISKGSYSSLLQFHDNQPDALLQSEQYALLSWQRHGSSGHPLNIGTLNYKGTSVSLSVKSVIFIVALHRLYQYGNTHLIERKQLRDGELLFARFSCLALLEILGVDVCGEADEDDLDLYQDMWWHSQQRDSLLTFDDKMAELKDELYNYCQLHELPMALEDEFLSDEDGKQCKVLSHPVNISESAYNNSVERFKKELSHSLIQQQIEQLLPIASKKGLNTVPNGYSDFEPIVQFIKIENRR